MEIASLHHHSWYSILDGRISPEEVVEWGVACGVGALGLVDTGSMAGAVRFY